MKFNKNGFTLIELQMASLLMVVVLIATGVIFYFSLASIRYIHDAAMVYSNANTAMKTLTDEIMVSNCWGYDVWPSFATPRYSFYGNDGYVHGMQQDDDSIGTAAIASLQFMPVYGPIDSSTNVLYLRQAPQGHGIPSTAGDFPNHDNMAIFTVTNAAGIGEMHVSVANLAKPNVNAGTIVAHHITNFDFQPIAYNCVAVRVTVTGTVLDPLDPSGTGTDPYYEVTLGKMVTLRCAPTKKPWLLVGEF